MGEIAQGLRGAAVVDVAVGMDKEAQIFDLDAFSGERRADLVLFAGAARVDQDGVLARDEVGV